MPKLAELKKKRSDELQKPKNARNNTLIRNLHEEIEEQKSIMQQEYKKREAETRKAEVNLKLSLWKKKNDRYGKIRESKKKERIEQEKRQKDKLQQKKKAK